MSERIVVCDNTSYYGRLFSRYLEKKTDIKYFRHKDYRCLVNEIKSDPPGTVIIFSGSISDKERLLISGIKKTSEQSRIIVCTNVTGGNSAKLLVNMSADYIIGMPIGIQELYRLISGMLGFDSEYRLESEIEFFLKFKELRLLCVLNLKEEMSTSLQSFLTIIGLFRKKLIAVRPIRL